MKIKKPILYFTVITIVGLFITSATSLKMQQKSTQQDEIKVEFLFVQCQPLLKTKNVDKPIIHPLFSGVQITGGDYDELHPSIARSPFGGFYALVEETWDGSVWNPCLYGSTDGVVWELLTEFLFDNAEYTDMDQNAYGTYGTCGAPPDDSGQIIILQGEIEGGWIWDWSNYNMNQFSNNHIACYTFEGPEGDPGTWNWGGVTFTGNNYNGANIVGCPFISYQVSEEGVAMIEWLTGAVSGCEHTGSTMDLEKNILYSVYDRYTGTQWELLVRKDNFGIWSLSGSFYTHPNIFSKQLNLPSANLKFPSVAANNDNVIVTCQKNNDIIVFYSTNGFESYTELTVQTSASYPEIVIDTNGKAVLTYIKNNILYYRTSNTSGATWSDEEVVSDNQVNLNNRAANLDEFNGSVYTTWEDTRGLNIDAYFDAIYELNPPNTPNKPSGPNSGYHKISYNYSTSTIDPEDDNVSYGWDWGDGNPVEWSGWYNSSETCLMPHSWNAPGTYDVRVKAKDTTNAESSWSPILTVVMDNHAPDKPIVSGQTSGKKNIDYVYTTNTTDIDGDQINYWFDWGDNTTSGWVGPYTSGETGSANHTWTKRGTYQIIVKAMDEYGLESVCSDPLSVTIPRDKAIDNQFLKLFENHLLLFKMIQLFFKGL